MWLAWRHGACLVPAPRSLVRSGMDLGPWLVANAGHRGVHRPDAGRRCGRPRRWTDVRLLILGGEACPPELGARLAPHGREVWNTYGPTEATVVACGARLTGDGRCGSGCRWTGGTWPSSTPTGSPSPPGETGELIIGGVGLARYLDPAKDAEKFAPMPTPGLGARLPQRATSCVNDAEGLLFVGRADDQVKVGGRRIELGEIDSALLDLPGVTGAAAAVRRTAGGQPAPGRLHRRRGDFDAAAAVDLAAQQAAGCPGPAAGGGRRPAHPHLRQDRPGRPALAAALGRGAGDDVELSGTQAWSRDHWRSVLGSGVSDRDADFFDLGGGSLAAAQMVSRLRRTRTPR